MKLNIEKCCISIIIPMFNGERYVSKCLNSILSQSLRQFEVIIVDDGSTDNSFDIAKQYSNKDKRIRVFRQKNSGPVCARVKGLKEIKGDYFTFCDIDDYYSSKYSLERMYNCIIESSCDMIQFGYFKKLRFLSLKRAGIEKDILNHDQFIEHEYPKLLCGYWNESSLETNVWNKLYRKSLTANVSDDLLNEKVFMGEDLILNLYLCEKCNKVKYISEPLYCYRDLTGFTCRWKTKDMYDLDKIKQHQIKFLNKVAIENKDVFLKELYIDTASWFFSHIRNGIDKIEEDEMTEYIKKVLSLPSFIQAHNYFMINQSEKRLSAELIREADPQKYISAAKAYKKDSNRSVKSLIRKIM